MKKATRKDIVVTKLRGADKSLRNSKMIHGLPLNSDSLLASLAPKDLSLKDAKRLLDVGVDVINLPGMYKVSLDDQLAEAERTVMATTGFLQAAAGKRDLGDIPIDSMWKSSQRHGLGRVKGADDLNDLIENIEEARETAFEQQDDYLYVIMANRHYTEREIETYQETGGLGMITRSTYQNYLSLLNTIRQRYHDAPRGTPWTSTQAHGLLVHHSNKLLALRVNANTKGHFILRAYTYLRDAQDSKFYHPSMTKYLWNQLTSLKTPPARNDGTELDNTQQAPDRCPHCRNRALHSKLHLPHTKTKCPFKDVDQGTARKGAGKGVTLLAKDGSLGKEAMVVKALEATKT
jgi:hypothetical protein